jgi:tetratricopeptide (TPR) repeat protein
MRQATLPALAALILALPLSAAAQLAPPAPPPGEFDAIGPGLPKPQDVLPEATDPDATGPEATGPDAADPDAGKPGAPGPDAGVPGPGVPKAVAPPAPGAAPEAKSARKGVDTKPADPKDRDAMLAELYAHLAKAPDAEQAAPIASTIENLWAYTDSPTVGVLMMRSAKAINDKNPELALKLLDTVVELGPDYAEGFSRRAYVYYLQNDVEHAVGDLRRALALEPNHYKALEGLARILREGGQKKSALGAYQQLLKIYPFMPGAKDAADELSVEVEGQKI